MTSELPRAMLSATREPDASMSALNTPTAFSSPGRGGAMWTTTPVAAASGRLATLARTAAFKSGETPMGFDSLEASDISLPPRTGWLNNLPADAAMMDDAAMEGLIDTENPPRAYASNSTANASDRTKTAGRESRFHIQLPRFSLANPTSKPNRPFTVPGSTASSEWSVVEDRLLLTLEDRGADLVAGYAQAQERQPILYPKSISLGSNASSELIRARVAVLRSPGMKTRARLLRGLSDEEAEALTSAFRAGMTTAAPGATPSGLSGSVMTSQDAAYNASMESGVASVGSRAAAHDLQSHRSNAPKIVLRGITRLQAKKSKEVQAELDTITQGSPLIANRSTENLMSTDLAASHRSAFRVQHEAGETITCSAQHICARSRYLKALYDEAVQDHQLRFGSAGKVANVPTSVTIDLNEADAMYQKFESMEDVFAIDNLRRFAQFAETPSLLHERETKTAECERIDAELQTTKVELRDAATNAKNAKLDAIAAAEKTALSAANAQLNAWLQEDIAALHAVYNAHRHVELGKLKKAFQSARDEANAFFAAEESSLSNLIANSGVLGAGRGQNAIQAELSEINRRIMEVLPRYGLTRLLLLSELVLAADLRDTCVSLIAKDLPAFAHDKALASPIINASTLEELCVKVPLQDLIATCQKAGLDTSCVAALDNVPSIPTTTPHTATGVPPEFLWGEFCRRCRDAFAAYKRLSAGELRYLRSQLQTAIAATNNPTLGSSLRLASTVRPVSMKPFCDTESIVVFKDLLLRALTEAERVSGRQDSLSPAVAVVSTLRKLAAQGAASPPLALQASTPLGITASPSVQWNMKGVDLVTSISSKDNPNFSPSISLEATVNLAEHGSLTQDFEGFGPLCASAQGVSVYGCHPRTKAKDVEPVTISSGISIALHTDRWLKSSLAVGCRVARRLMRITPTVTHGQHAAAAGRRCGECTLNHYFEARIVSVAPKCALAVTFAIGFEALSTTAQHAAESDLAAAWRRLDSGTTSIAAAPGTATASVMWTSDGVLIHDGRSHMFPTVETGASYTLGDVVGMGLDERTGSVCFTKNGRLLTPPATLAPSSPMIGSAPSTATTPQPSTLTTPTKAAKAHALDVSTAVDNGSSGPWLSGVLLGQGPMVPVATIYSAGDPLPGADAAVMGVNFAGPWYSAKCRSLRVNGENGHNNPHEALAPAANRTSSIDLPPFDAFVDAIAQL